MQLSHSQEPQLAESIRLVSDIVEAAGYKRIFIVLDEIAYETSGAKSHLEDLLQRHNATRFTGFQVNPKIEDVQQGIEQYLRCTPDLIIALGGGTAIDLAKLISAFAVQPTAPIDIATGRTSIAVKRKPLMAIPTTAGTGSEATHFAVVYVDGKKYSVAHPSLLPDYAVVDSTLAESLPRHMTAATGLDALCQAIESIWAVGANDESMGYAVEAARLAFGHLATATNAPTPEARQAMSRAAHLAGKAINITKTTAPHAISYALTSRHGVPHGMAVAITLAPLLKFNANVTEDDCTDPRGPGAVQSRIQTILDVLQATDAAEACCKITDLLTEIGCPTTLDAVGVRSRDDLLTIANSVNAERLSNNPRRASRDCLFDILDQI